MYSYQYVIEATLNSDSDSGSRSYTMKSVDSQQKSYNSVAIGQQPPPTNSNNICASDEGIQCTECADYIAFDEFFKHESECRNQGIKCPHCCMAFPFNLFD